MYKRQGDDHLLYQIVKRLLDILISLALFLLLLPLFLLIMLAIAVDSPGDIIFMQKRAGLYSRPFTMLKFRSMRAAAPPDVATNDLADAGRYITPVGRFLRRTSLDELPQLINVVLGGMSLVGPRPIVSGEIEKYGEVYDEYCRVKPGITGLWQISGRNDTSYEERVAYDHYYINNWSVWMDLWILGRTVPVVLSGYGAY